MAELLEFDAAASNIDGTDPGSPLSIMTSTYRVLSHSYASPEEQVLFASSVDTEGEIRASSKPTNRTITMSIEATGTTAANARTALTALQAKVAKIRREGGTLKRTLITGQVIIFDLITAGAFDPTFDIKYEVGNVISVDLTFTAKPDGRGALVTVGSNASSTVMNIQTITNVTGDRPALGKLQITDTSGVDQFWCAWGLRQRYYSNSANAALFYEAEGRTRLNSATIPVPGVGGVSPTGSASWVRLPTGLDWRGIISTQATGGGAHMSHVGDYRVFARVAPDSSNVGALSWALEWSTGDFRSFARNPAVTLPAGHSNVNLKLIDLGMISIPPSATRWEGRVIVKSSSTADAAFIDCLMLMPTTEGYGEVSGTWNMPTPTAIVGQDNFSGSAGVLNATTLTLGGSTWATAGSTTDFQKVPNYVTRATTSDTSARTAVTSAAAVASAAVQFDVFPGANGIGIAGPIVKWTSVTDFVAVAVSAVTTGYAIRLVHYAGGTTVGTVLSETVTYVMSNAYTVTIKVAASAAGHYAIWAWPQSGVIPIDPLLTGYASELDAITGKVGFFDINPGAGALTRSYDNFITWTPTFDAAIFASQTLEVNWAAAIREDSAGSFYAPVSRYQGDYFTVPPAGAEARTTQIAVITSRGEPNGAHDLGIDAKGVQAFYYPRYLVIS